MVTIASIGNKAGAMTMGDDYRPREDEPFMNDRQLEYFKTKLLNWKDDILKESRETLSHLQTETENHPDLADRASSETDRALELRTRDRQRKLISKIDSALRRVEEGRDARAHLLQRRLRVLQQRDELGRVREEDV